MLKIIKIYVKEKWSFVPFSLVRKIKHLLKWSKQFKKKVAITIDYDSIHEWLVRERCKSVVSWEKKDTGFWDNCDP